MAHVCGYTGCAADIIEAQGGDEGVALEEEGEGLADASAGAEDGDLCVAGSGGGEAAGGRAEGSAGEHGAETDAVGMWLWPEIGCSGASGCMAADFWLSSHQSVALNKQYSALTLPSKRWIVDRATARRARETDRLVLHALGHDAVQLDYFAIYFANGEGSVLCLSPRSPPAVITKLGKKLGLRQRVIATATVFFRRFYLKNAYCETDPFLVIAACCYVAAKAEESPVHIKTVISEARTLFSRK